MIQPKFGSQRSGTEGFGEEMGGNFPTRVGWGGTGVLGVGLGVEMGDF